MNFIEPTAPGYQEIKTKLDDWAEYFESKYRTWQLEFHYNYGFSFRNRNPFLVLTITYQKDGQEGRWHKVLEIDRPIVAGQRHFLDGELVLMEKDMLSAS